jgi:ribonuclease Z
LDNKTTEFLREQLGISDLQTTGVYHCVGAQAISLIFEKRFKFSYTGDCRPSVPFATIGKGSDVPVHEAMFDDDMEGDALAEKHCTTGEALGVAAKMEAKNVILTHFSQWYQKLPVMENMKLPISTAESTSASN